MFGMNDEKISDSVQNRMDLKACTIGSLTQSIEMLIHSDKVKLDSNTTVTLITNFGNVEGTFDYSTVDDDNASVSSSIINAAVKVRNTFISQNETADTIWVNNCGMITLLDATITPFATPNIKQHYANLSLFTDQIVGFTFGTKETK